MATRLYLRNVAASASPSAGDKSARTATTTTSGAALQDRALSLTKGSAETSNTVGGAASTANQNIYLARFSSGVLSVSSISAGTWTIGLRANESNASANAFMSFSLYVWNATSGAVRGFIYDTDSSLGTEVAGTGQVYSISGAAVSGIAANDYLVLEVWTDQTQAMATAYTVSAFFDGTTDVTAGQASDAASYIETSQNIVAIPTTFTQSNYRFRNDDGTESTATWKAAAGTNISQLADQNVRLRMEVSSATTAPTGGGVYQLQYSKNGGAYADVNASSSNVRSSASPNVTDGAATTEQMAGAQAFNAGTFDEVDGAATGFTGTTALNDQSELEYSFQVRGADVAVGDTLDFRLLRAGVVLDTYSVTPRITVTAVDTDVRVSFPTPATTPTDGAGLQEFRVRVRKKGTGGNPTCAVQLFETGGSTALATPIAATAVSSTVGVTLTGSWDSALLATNDGSAVEARVVGTGAPSGSLEVGAIDWNGTLDAAAPIANKELRVSFDSPSGTLMQGPSYQEFRFLARKSAAGNDRTVSVELWENGTFLSTILSNAAVNSTTGNVISATWNAALLSDQSGANVECKIITDATTAMYVQIGAVEWNAAVASSSNKTKSLSATVTLTASVGKVSTYPRTYAASSTLSAAVSKSVSRSYPGAITLSPALSIARVALKSLAGVTTLSPVLLKGVGKALLATTTLTPSVTRLLSLLRSYAATITLTPQVAAIRTLLRSLSASVSLTPQLSAIKVILRSYLGSLTLSPLLVQRVGKLFAASTTLTPSMTRVLSVARSFSSALTLSASSAKAMTTSRLASITLAPQLVSAIKVILRSVSGSLTLAPLLVQRVGKLFAASTTLTPSVARVLSVARAFASTVTLSASSAKAMTTSRLANITLTPLASVQGSGKLALSATIALSASLLKRISSSRLATITLTPALSSTRALLRSYVATITLTPALAALKVLGRAFSATTTLTPSVKRSAQTARSVAISLVPRALRQVQVREAAIVVLSPAFNKTRALLRSLLASTTLTPTVTALKVFPRTLAAAITLTPRLVRSANRSLLASVTLTGSVSRRIATTLSGSLNLLASNVKRVSTSRVASVLASASLSTVKAKFTSFIASTTLLGTESALRTANKSLSSTLGVQALQGPRVVGKAIVAPIATLPGASRFVGRTIRSALDLVGSVLRAPQRSVPPIPEPLQVVTLNHEDAKVASLDKNSMVGNLSAESSKVESLN